MKSSREIIKLLEKDGWKEVNTTGSHNHFGHDDKESIVTVPHPKKDLARRTIQSIEKQSRIKIL